MKKIKLLKTISYGEMSSNSSSQKSLIGKKRDALRKKAKTSVSPSYEEIQNIIRVCWKIEKVILETLKDRGYNVPKTYTFSEFQKRVGECKTEGDISDVLEKDSIYERKKDKIK